MKCFTKRPTAKQGKIIKTECRKEFYKLLDQYNRESALQVLYVLHFGEKYGEKKLMRVIDMLNEMQRMFKETYMLEDSDTAWICEKKLRDAGLDVDKILKVR
jgi:hypothetical protein